MNVSLDLAITRVLKLTQSAVVQEIQKGKLAYSTDGNGKEIYSIIVLYTNEKPKERPTLLYAFPVQPGKVAGPVAGAAMGKTGRLTRASP